MRDVDIAASRDGGELRASPCLIKLGIALKLRLILKERSGKAHRRNVLARRQQAKADGLTV